MKFHSNIFGWEYAWQEFANEMGGTADVDPESNPSLKQIQIPVAGVGTMYFFPQIHKVSSQADTTVLAIYKPADIFVFGLHTQKFLNSVGKLLGAQDIIVGDKAIDQRFIIQSNNEQRVTTLLSDPQLKQLLLDRPDMHLRILGATDKLPEAKTLPVGHNAICYTQHQTLNNYDELTAVYRMLTAMTAFAMKPEQVETTHTRISEGLLHR